MTENRPSSYSVHNPSFENNDLVFSPDTLQPLSKIIKREKLPTIRESYKDKIISFATGVFDIVHLGHVQFLISAKKEADILVVGINSDASVKILKGEDRPINPEEDRIGLVAAFGMVDVVFRFDSSFADEELESLRPNIYTVFQESIFADKPEIITAKQLGCAIRIIPRFGSEYSSTSIISRIKSERK